MIFLTLVTDLCFGAILQNKIRGMKPIRRRARVRINADPTWVLFGHLIKLAKVDPTNSAVCKSKKQPTGTKYLLCHLVPLKLENWVNQCRHIDKLRSSLPRTTTSTDNLGSDSRKNCHKCYKGDKNG